MDPENRNMIKNIIDAVIVKSRVQKVLKPLPEESWEGRMRKMLSKLRERTRDYSEEDILRMVDESVKATRLEEEKRPH